MELLTQSLPFWRRMQLKVANFWTSLSLSEKLYVLAAISWFVFSGDIIATTILTFIAITLEFWPRFNKWWDSLAGKAVILLFYGTLTNFALASASSLVNSVATVPASHFDYTHNFALLLMLPFWFIATSFMALLAFQAIAPFYLFLLVILKPFGISKVRLLSKSEHPVFTNLLRFSLSMVLFYQVVELLDSQAHSNNPYVQNNWQQNAQTKPDGSTDKVTAAVTTKDKVEEPETIEPLQLTFGESGESFASTTIDLNISNGYQSMIRSGIAHFAFYLEADEYSRCKKQAKSRVVELNDYEILEITRNKKAEYGFDFVVKKCISPAFPES